MSDKKSPRQELKSYVCDGRLSAMLSRSCGLSAEARELLVTIALRYCDPPKPRKSN